MKAKKDSRNMCYKRLQTLLKKCGNISDVIKKSKMVQQSNIDIAISFSFKRNLLQNKYFRSLQENCIKANMESEIINAK